MRVGRTPSRRLQVRPLLVFSLFLAVALLAPVASAAGTTLLREVSNATANETTWMNGFDTPAAAVADFDGDGHAELVNQNDNQHVYVLSTKEARVLAEFKPPYPSGWGARPLGDPAVADVEGDGDLDIILTTSAAQVCVYKHDPSQSTATALNFDFAWCKRMDLYDGSTAGADAGVAVADVDGDGTVEIFSQTEEKGLFCFNHDGSIRWSKSDWGGNAGPLVTDLDGDGRREAIFFSDGGHVRSFDAATGNQEWAFFASNYVFPASIPVSGNAADMDGDGKKEVVFIARHASHTDDYRKNHFMIFALKPDGALKWRQQPTWGNPMSYTHPIFDDVNGDGNKDVIAQDWNTIGHKPGGWEKLGPANVFAYDGWGNLLWRTSFDSSWSNDDLALADVDGDGFKDVLALGYAGGIDGIWYLDARNGVQKQHIPIYDWVPLRGVVAGDFDFSGDTEWAVSVHKTDKGGGYLLYDTGAPCVIGFGGWQNPTPCSPQAGGDSGGSTPPPPPPPPPPPGDFAASFRNVRGNEWWVESDVIVNKPLAGVDARLNGGAWVNLELKSWGSWARSIHAPAGSIVEFQARATTGETALSGKYRWPEATLVDGSGGGTTPPPPTGFTVSFKNVRGNEWWVETDVTANKALAGVDARVNGGAWVSLELKSWGSWAKSIHAVAGSTVEFRARATTGESATSGPYWWPPS